ncbi:hypothetical protein AWV79_06155 [Cupriavidus sp. UYMMa02A]|nr:hypothetical protein AWV79_06155 [Cupriavidus sp. UYMMa02A]
MPQSNLAADAIPRRRALQPRGVRTEAAPVWIRFRLAVASTEVFTIRRALQGALGQLARIYIVKVDHRHDETTVQVEVARADRDHAMDAIMHALPAAEFGFATVLGDDHVAH